MKKYALDVFDLLNRINDPNSGDIYASLSAEEKAAFSPLITMRWMSGSNDNMEVSAINEFVNPYVFSLAKHPQLLMLLLQVCSSKKRKRYNWVAAKAPVKDKLSVQVLQEALGMSSKEVLKVHRPSANEILKMAESLGWQTDELTKLKKELEASNEKGK